MTENKIRGWIGREMIAKQEINIKKAENGYILFIVSGKLFSEAYTSEVYATFPELLKRIEELLK